jgi:serine/threonine-protein kinase RsbT
MSVAILQHGEYLIASIQSDLTDAQVLELRDTLADGSASTGSRHHHRRHGHGRDRLVRGSFAAVARRHHATAGRETVIVGIQPDVAIALVHFSLNLQPLHTALDLDEGQICSTAGPRGSAAVPDDVVVAIASDRDLITARAEARAQALALGFSRTDATLIATAISEIARNIIVHARRGMIAIRGVRETGRLGLVIVAEDEGPGIRDVEAALQDGHSGGGGFGLGLPGARRLMDEFEVVSAEDRGTTVTMTKWRVGPASRRSTHGGRQVVERDTGRRGDDFRAAYAFALRRFVEDGGESLLQAGYELGRGAVRGGLSVLDMAAAHHDVLLAAVRRASTPAEVARVTEAAGDFFLESLSAYEMIRRGFVETQDAARIERRHAEMLRQLSTFLADASLAVDADASAREILRLVAEQARDLIGADWCVASTLPHGGTAGAEAVSSATVPRHRTIRSRGRGVRGRSRPCRPDMTGTTSCASRALTARRTATRPRRCRRRRGRTSSRRR